MKTMARDRGVKSGPRGVGMRMRVRVDEWMRSMWMAASCRKTCMTRPSISDMFERRREQKRRILKDGRE